MRLESKVALITGGYGGMGRASARLFAKEGATVFIAGRNKERGDAVAAEINEAGGKAHFVELDVAKQDQWDAAIIHVKEQAGALHTLMNIVGSNALVRLPNVDIDEWNKIFEINVTGTLRGIQTCAPLMKESGGGSIVNIGSVAGITGNFSTGYSSSKWALEGLSRSAAYVYADWRIRCNVIQPGFIGKRHRNPCLVAGKDFLAAVIAPISNGFEFVDAKDLLRLRGNVRKLCPIRAAVRHLMGNDQVMFGFHRNLHVVADHAGAAPARGHRAAVWIGQRDLLIG